MKFANRLAVVRGTPRWHDFPAHPKVSGFNAREPRGSMCDVGAFEVQP
jgi:hypothetical protein